MSRALVVVGDALLDVDVEGRVDRVCPDAPAPVLAERSSWARPGGAGLAAALLAGDGRDVVLVTALGCDEDGRRLATLLDDAGVEVVDVGTGGSTPVKNRLRSGHQTLVRLDRGTGAVVDRDAGRHVAAVLGSASAALVADYGYGLTRSLPLPAQLRALDGRVPVVWDPHPRGTPPARGALLTTPNSSEAASLVPDVEGDGVAAQRARARALTTRYGVRAAAVTLGPAGVLLVDGDGPPLVVPVEPAADRDPCGAGDRFSSSAAAALGDGAVLSEAVVAAAESAASFVRRGGASSLRPGSDRPAGARPAAQVQGPSLESVRREGGTIVAAGGCFDLIHAGHVRLLEGARRLGDLLVVCINSDASVRRLKGPERPVVPLADRIRVLEGLASVDLVVPFDEDTPERVLRELRPTLFVKGGDYAHAELPEAATLRRWGGEAVVLPYLPGRSTTRLLEEADHAERARIPD